VENVVFTVPTIDCAVCVQNIERTLTKTPGVESVTVDLATKLVIVGFDAATLNADTVAERLEAAGFLVEPAD